jgi:aminoglycoside 6'-N-acetyltransferase I
MTTAPCSTRHALPADLDVLASFAATLWPDGTTESHAEHFALILRGEPPSTLPLLLFVAEVEGDLAGFLEVGLRSHADGCDPSHPVAFVEGWFVAETHRARGVGRALVSAAEEWGREQGCREIASDTWLDNQPSQRAHEALGFTETDRVVTYRKALPRSPPPPAHPSPR